MGRAVRDIVPFQGAFAQLFAQDTTIASVVFCLVVVSLGGAIAASRWRRRRGRPASRRAEANRLELGYVALLAGIVVFLVVTGFMANARDFPDPPKPAVTVRVTGYQWCWRFAYAGTQASGTPVTVTGQCQAGTPPALVVPAGEPVQFNVTSADVVHAFWLPQQRLKVNAYPGQVNRFTVTFPQAGQWTGRCAQLCGIYHYDMDFTVKAVPPAAFSDFLRTGGS
jgi:cytochrome c oxidase subunit 2